MQHTNLYIQLKGVLHYFAAKSALIETLEREQVTFLNLIIFEDALKVLEQLANFEPYEGTDKNKIIEENTLIKTSFQTLNDLIKEGHNQILRLQYIPYFDEKDILLINTVLNIIEDIMMFWINIPKLEKKNELLIRLENIDEIVSNFPYKVEKISIGIK